MGRTKATPVKFGKTLAELLTQGRPVKPKRTPKKSSVQIGYNVLPPDDSNEQYYLGDIYVGTTSNVLPEHWTKSRVTFIRNEMNWNLQMDFHSHGIVLISVTNDFTFIKGLFTSKIFSMRFRIEDCSFVAELFLSELPLTRFNNQIGNIIKMAVATTCNVEVEKIDDTDTSENLVEAKLLAELYKNVKTVREKDIKIPKVPVQNDFLKPKLRPYQEEAVQWMMLRETEPENAEMLHPLYQVLSLKSGTIIYFNKHTGHIELTKPLVSSLRTGGILADEMGLGKTVEVIACIFSHPKLRECDQPISEKSTEDEEENDSTADESVDEKSSSVDDDASNSQECPTVLMQPRKRKRESGTKDTFDNYVDKPKRLKVPDDWVKSSSKKSPTFVALETWYNSMLQEVSTKNVPKQPSCKVQCICGDTHMKGTVKCVGCNKYQHSKCLGYKKGSGEYRCPQCWMEQPYLESKATLIVCPMSLRSQWCEEICKHVRGGLKLLVYEGSKAAPVYPTKLQEYDLVLTTYNVLQSELRLSESGQPISLRREPRYCPPGSPLARISWWRLCLDEAQTVEVPSCMISTMAKKLQARHRWAITGTPIARDVSDLYGLIDYLQLDPYNEQETWEHLLYLPYLSGNTEPMLKFLAQVMWRSSKSDVIEQINIPSQTVKEYELEFSAVEKFYYRREHELCTNRFLIKLQEYDCNIPLRFLDRSNLNTLLWPVRSICQACTHPSASRGRYLATRKPVTSMEDLLEALIEKIVTDSEENLRVIVSALNGLAGIHLLLQNSVQAVEDYREVMQLAGRFNSEDPSKGVSVDKLQLIHTVYNLAEVLQTYPPVQPTLRDGTLGEYCLELQEKYMERYFTQNLTAYKESMTSINSVSVLQEKSTLVPGQWYSLLVDWVIVNDLMGDLRTRIDNMLDNANNKKLNFANERRLLYLVTIWDEDVTNLRLKTINLLNQMYNVSGEDNKITVSEGLVQSAMDCHLRPQKRKKNFKKCFVCSVSIAMRQYEAKLFDMANTKNEEDISNKGSWKPTSEELVLKALLSLAKARNADSEVTTNGDVYFNILDAMKKEFKKLRKFWTYLDQQICAGDEINMCKTRLSLKDPNQEHNNKRLSKTDNILKQLSSVLENKLEFINLIGEHELEYQVSVLKSEKEQNMTALERNLGTHSYLETLRGQQYAGQSPDPCPICKNALQDNWSILPCGHCYCLECIQLLLEKTNANRIACSICRQFQKIDDVSYIRMGDEAVDKDCIKIKGNYSTKIEAIIKLIMKLKNEDDKVKILVFSVWTAALKILKNALEINDVTTELLLQTNLQQCLNKFKDKNKNVTVLLLNIQMGSKGLNLIEATHVVLVEPLLNPSDELQAIGRVHRIGQTKPTTIHKFIVKNTVEETIHHATSSNADEWDKNKVTLQQFKNLFMESLEDHPVVDLVEEVPPSETDEN